MWIDRSKLNSISNSCPHHILYRRRNLLDGMINPEGIPSSADHLVSGVAVSPIRVVTFDLDNTLWNTGATIGSANDVLAQFLNENNIVQSKRTEDIMGDLFQASKSDYCPLATKEELDTGAVKAPILLTKLRKDALKQILMADNGYSEADAVEFADQAFDKVRLALIWCVRVLVLSPVC